MYMSFLDLFFGEHLKDGGFLAQKFLNLAIHHILKLSSIAKLVAFVHISNVFTFVLRILGKILAATLMLRFIE